MEGPSGCCEGWRVEWCCLYIIIGRWRVFLRSRWWSWILTVRSWWTFFLLCLCCRLRTGGWYSTLRVWRCCSRRCWGVCIWSPWRGTVRVCFTIFTRRIILLTSWVSRDSSVAFGSVVFPVTIATLKLNIFSYVCISFRLETAAANQD